ncbi:electrogenic aspartate/glutamate antiporter SLC25A13, mitochondrial-like isoform X1 [Rhopilema esculentum]|uniref:electrogenic aspartate/glutamate antiporter SLC25A13, mitochondrial-like isoform X1 n=1 Tax=Rhopilema esculentum TaxID=499914 RepID=UPI0031E0AECC
MDFFGNFFKSTFARSVALCDAPLFDYTVKRANPDDLRVVFYKYASVEENGERYMTPHDFVRDFLQMDAACFNDLTFKLFTGCVDQTKDGLISFPEFQAFEALLCKPDAKYRLLFQLFDLDGKGSITFGEFQHVVKSCLPYAKFPFDFSTDFTRAFFGEEKNLSLSYTDFTHFMQEFERQYLKQAFSQQLKKGRKDATITALQFGDIVRSLLAHKLSSYTAENIPSLASDSGSRRITLMFCLGFNELLDNLPSIQQLFKQLTQDDKFKSVTKEEVLRQAQRNRQVTPLQIEILFQLCGLANPGVGKISLADVNQLVPKQNPLTVFSKIHEIKKYDIKGKESDKEVKRSFGVQALESLYRFGLGSLAGAAGATTVYPIDLVKTRMQNQRSVLASELMYKNSFDCAKKVIQNEGILGLYRGLLPQLVGVSPEKAIKLTTNDFVRGKMTDKDGEIPLYGEILAGGCGGSAQVMFTNPIEIVKIRMQVAGEVAGHKPSALNLCSELGLFGLYKGARACFLRDIPFSAIYFPCYAHLKLYLADENGYNNWPSLLFAATGAGVPAAYLVTPADVIKTRLQVKARRGQQSYRGVIDCFRKVWAEEGGKAFWKGGPARIFRSSPQFGVTLLVYEMLQRFLYVDFGGGSPKTELAPVNPEVSVHPDHIGGLRLAVSTYSGIETKFGLFLPKFQAAPPRPALQQKLAN